MLKMSQDNEPPSDSDTSVRSQSLIYDVVEKPHEKEAFGSWIKNLVRTKSDSSLREAIEEYIDDKQNGAKDHASSQERLLLANILKLRTITVVDVMIPRADIIAIEANTTGKELLELLSKKQFSRLPVYRESLDDVIGTIHIKDILAVLARDQDINISELLTDVPIVSPSMSVLDLLLEMRESRRHMAMVVDEYGGIDGLVTIGDVIEAIVGEIEDEHNPERTAEIIEEKDGVLFVDPRVDLEEFEKRYGQIFSEQEHQESDTLGGLIFSITGRVPARGEIISHSSGMLFEILEADPRRIHLMKVRNIPA